MKKGKIFFLMITLIFLFLLSACENPINDVDVYPPAPPQNVTSKTGDNKVVINWYMNSEKDLDGYNVYYSLNNKDFHRINNYIIRENYFIDLGAKNGEKTYYAVTAVDFSGNESELSKDLIWNTPRPEGINYSLFHIDLNPQNSGFSFTKKLVVAFTSDDADFFFEIFEGKAYLDVWSDSDIIDMGKTETLNDVKEAPNSGWSAKYVKINDKDAKYEEAKEGHTYVINTWNNHYAKVRITKITNERVFFDWAYQINERDKSLEKKNRENRNYILGEKLNIVR